MDFAVVRIIGAIVFVVTFWIGLKIRERKKKKSL